MQAVQNQQLTKFSDPLNETSERGDLMDELLREQHMLQQGAERYVRTQEKALQRNELTSAHERLFKSAVGKVQEALEKALEESEGKRGAKPAWHLPTTSLGSLKTAVITLRIAFSKVVEKAGYARLCESIGRQLEVEMIAKAVEEKDVAAYKKLTKRVKNLPGIDFKSKVFTEGAAEGGFWEPLGPGEHVKMGSSLFNFVLEVTDLFTTHREEFDDPYSVTFTEETVDRLREIEGIEAWMRPVYRPMVSAPAPWESAFTGCYQDPRLSKTFKIMKTSNREHISMVNEAIKGSAPFVEALNTIQNVPLRINEFVLKWVEKAYDLEFKIKSFPSRETIEIRKDAPRGQKAALRKKLTEQKSEQANFHRDLQEAKEYATYGTFWLPGQLDWRGRVYAKPHLNHQREDHCKALFEFANGKPLDSMGAVWLAIHVATTGGFEKVDKAPLETRYAWTREHTERIIRTAENPARDLWWTEADSPFCFLAACKAWADYNEQGDAYVCHLPVAADGSCSGLQHLSAALKDPVGAKAVNLLPQETPSDVYRIVAEAVHPLVERDAKADNIHAQRWLSIGVDRKVAKRCVMTYVYGSKQFGFAEHLAEDFEKELQAAISPSLTKEPEETDWQFEMRGKKELGQCASYLAKHIWDAVRTTVQAAADAMDWLQEIAGLMASENLPVIWRTPQGFPVVNAYFKPQVEKVDLVLFDRVLQIPTKVQSRVMTGETDELMSRKQRSSISPNFVHSLDASHLQAVALKAKEEGITDLLLIHDSFGCLPTDMPRFVQIVRETFVEQYENNDPLQDLHDRALGVLSEKGKKKLKPPPAKGSFDLSMVLESHYAFA